MVHWYGYRSRWATEAQHTHRCSRESCRSTSSSSSRTCRQAGAPQRLTMRPQAKVSCILSNASHIYICICIVPASTASASHIHIHRRSRTGAGAGAGAGREREQEREWERKKYARRSSSRNSHGVAHLAVLREQLSLQRELLGLGLVPNGRRVPNRRGCARARERLNTRPEGCRSTLLGRPRLGAAPRGVRRGSRRGAARRGASLVSVLSAASGRARARAGSHGIAPPRARAPARARGGRRCCGCSSDGRAPGDTGSPARPRSCSSPSSPAPAAT